MSSEEDRRQLQADRAALRTWWAGDHAQPFVLPHRHYCACCVLLPTATFKIRILLRSAMAMIISKIPVSRIKVFAYRLLGTKIGKSVYIAPGVWLDPLYPQLIELADGCVLGLGCRLLAHEYTTTHFRLGRVRIGADSVIGACSVVRSGVTIGRGVTTGLGSVVVTDVPDGLTVIGNPARPKEEDREKT